MFHLFCTLLTAAAVETAPPQHMTGWAGQQAFQHAPPAPGLRHYSATGQQHAPEHILGGMAAPINFAFVGTTAFNFGHIPVLVPVNVSRLGAAVESLGSTVGSWLGALSQDRTRVACGPLTQDAEEWQQHMTTLEKGDQSQGLRTAATRATDCRVVVKGFVDTLSNIRDQLVLASRRVWTLRHLDMSLADRHVRSADDDSLAAGAISNATTAGPRNRRFATAGIALAVGGLLLNGAAIGMGAYSVAELQEQKRIAEAHQTQLEDHEAALDILSTQLDETRRDIRQLRADTANAVSELRITIAQQRMEFALTQILQALRTAETTAAAALQGRLDGALLAHRKFDDLQRVFLRVSAASELQSQVKTISQLLQCRSELLPTAYGFDVIVAVPVAKPDSVMAMYRYLPLPIPATDEMNMVVELRSTMLAVSQDESSFRMMSQAALDNCRVIGPFRDCDDAGVLRRAPRFNEEHGRDDEICLWALFKSERELIRQACPLTFTPKTSRVVQTGDGKFAIMAGRTHHGSIRCPGGQHATQLKVPAGKVSSIALEPGCTATIDAFIMTASARLARRDWTIDHELAATDLVRPEDFGATTLEEIVAAGRVHGPAATSFDWRKAVEGLHTTRARRKLEESHIMGRVATALAGFAVLGVIAAVAPCAWREYNRRRSADPGQEEGFEGLAADELGAEMAQLAPPASAPPAAPRGRSPRVRRSSLRRRASERERSSSSDISDITEAARKAELPRSEMRDFKRNASGRASRHSRRSIHFDHEVPVFVNRHGANNAC